jgi:hypothetical protein
LSKNIFFLKEVAATSSTAAKFFRNPKNYFSEKIAILYEEKLIVIVAIKKTGNFCQKYCIASAGSNPACVKGF